jgi:molecular chaperone DnaK (HSP70)
VDEWKPLVGGEDFDTLLAEDVAAMHKKKAGTDIFTGDDKAAAYTRPLLSST